MSIADRYRLETPLEQGRFGTTYRAIDLRAAAHGNHASVAVWVLPPELASHGPALSAFRRDIERVSELVHPNIAGVLDVGQDGERMFVVTELTDGETLRSVLDALHPERLESTEADNVVESLGSALAYAHDRGIVHGDVRPENVLVTDDQRIRLANFMLASLARSTPFAPALSDDARALAAVAHEVYAGVPPGSGETARSLARVPRRRRKAITAALSAAPGYGPTVTEFLSLAGLACDAQRLRRPPPRSRALPAVPRWRFVLATLVLVVGAVVFSGNAISWWHAQNPPPGGTLQQRLDSPGRRSALQQEQPAPPTAALAAAPASAATTALGLTAPAAHTPQATHETAEQIYGRRITSPLKLAAASITVRESQRIAKVDVIRTGDAGTPLDFVWWTTDGTAHAGDDYASFGRRVESLAAGQTKRTLYIPLASDSVAERSETFFVHIDPASAAAPDAKTLTAEIRIIDDDRR